MKFNDESTLRTRMLIGDDGINKLLTSSVLVCGLGGVGGYVAEALARSGVGRIGVLDCDVISVSNLNRQILATMDTIGMKKTDAAEARIKSINPDCEIIKYDMFYQPETSDRVELKQFDYVIDAMDTVEAKLELITRAGEVGVAVISSMGTGNKLGSEFRISDIGETSVCPLARVMRRELKKRGIDGLKVVWSDEKPAVGAKCLEEEGRHIPGSISYAPAIAGMTLAGEVIRDLIGGR